jgi:inorganic pyrophosphatase
VIELGHAPLPVWLSRATIVELARLIRLWLGFARIAPYGRAKLRVFIENEAGSRTKNLYDQRTLAHLGTTHVSLQYPYPYGFVIGTLGGDGDAVDCFVLTNTRISVGDTIECDPIGLLEQVEDGKTDHKVLAVPSGEPPVLEETTVAELKSFISGVFSHVPDKRMEIGGLRGRGDAEAYVAASRDESAIGDHDT